MIRLMTHVRDKYHYQWKEASWLMELNPTKCMLMSVSHKRNTNNVYYINNGTLESVLCYKYLGVQITYNLSLNTDWLRH